MSDPDRPPGPTRQGSARRRLVLAGVGLLVVAGVAGVVLLTLARRTGPADAAEDYFHALQESTCEGSVYYSDSLLGVRAGAERDDTIEKILDACAGEESFADDGPLEGCEIEIGDVEEDDGTAEVDYELTGCASETMNKQDTLPMVREDGEWRVDSLLQFLRITG